MENLEPDTPTPDTAPDIALDEAVASAEAVDPAWAAARADYRAGQSAAFIAARLGVTERTVHRRAAREGWRRMDRIIQKISGDPKHEHAELEPDSPLGLFIAATEYEVGELLLSPEPMRYIRYAFRRSAEAAVRGRPAEALSWARLVAVLDRVAPGVSDSRHAFNSADYLRADFAEKLRHFHEPDEDDDG